MRRRGFLGAFVLACLALATFELGCGGSGGSGIANQPNTGGSLSTGGSTTTRGDGGTTGTGGAMESGGSRGGSSGSPTGGATTIGGGFGAGGTDGASTANGGATGGATASGGATGSGGRNGTGGVTADGGASGAGGSGTGGTGTGGTRATGPVTLSCPGAAPAGITPDWCSCDQWGQTTKGAATYYNDIWGSGAGGQCIWVSGSQWGVAANHPSGGGVKSYPNISYSPAKAISAINTYTSSFDLTVPSSGAWEVAYDYWVKNGSTVIEIMLWVNYTQGKVFPASSTSNPAVSNVNVGGHTWNVYYGAYGGHDVVSLLRTTNANSGTVDIMAITNWIITNKKSFTTSWTLDQFQFGFEIVSDGAVQSFICNSFSVSSS
jgi:hypothetical protein